MLKWVQGGLSAVAGTTEPEYGPEAIHPITRRVDPGHVSRATTKQDFEWQLLSYTNVETLTMYFTDLSTKNKGFAQIIYSQIMGVVNTAHFNLRCGKQWYSLPLENYKFTGNDVAAKNFSLKLNEDGTSYHLKSAVGNTIVDMTFQRGSPGVIFGQDGTTLYGTDVENPWGKMRHSFWPRCTVEGAIINNDVGKVELTSQSSKGMVVMALQGMKPHHAASSWNFLNYQGDEYSAVVMEFTTPKSYAKTRVNIGILVKGDEIVEASIDNEVIHEDPRTNDIWPVPQKITFKFPHGGALTAQLEHLVERVDVMAEIPQFVKNLVSNISGAKPYIYQYAEDFELQYKGNVEKGPGYCEVTFISE
ncbi:uncharacterized protein LODBEIA_P29730 [Lodderomyces beijingensis]|uniref:Survival factor 1 n=1 Tax=Lodderomyces beijingensis TaxID=1775926 RepID=A0ABP0ZLJ3_9ASCO